MVKTTCKPFVKWAGGKSQILDEIRKKYPKSLGTYINKYAEPFVGGGAVLFDIISNYDLDEIYISDKNKNLIYTYESIKDSVQELIEMLRDLSDRFIPLDKDGRKQFFYEKRTRFNELVTGTECYNHKCEIASLFIFLNRTCFNGLYRENRKGEYNVPIGSYKNPLILDEENLISVSELLKKVKIVNAEYYDSIDFIDDRTFVYFDPPYRPLNETSTFNSYTKYEFGDEQQKELAEYAKKLNAKGAKVLLSNSDPKNINEEDNFFDDIYLEFNIERIKANRMINSKSTGRGEISELLISNY